MSENLRVAGAMREEEFFELWEPVVDPYGVWTRASGCALVSSELETNNPTLWVVMKAPNVQVRNTIFVQLLLGFGETAGEDVLLEDRSFDWKAAAAA